MLHGDQTDSGRETRTAGAPKRATILDVATALGLSKGTVSRALNNYPDISESTKLRARQMAEKLGYMPLAQAQAIRTGRVRAIGLVLEVGEPDAHRPFLQDFLAGVTTAASLHGWSLTVSTARSDRETTKVLDRLVAERKADGFILPRTRLQDPRIETLRRAGVPFVLFGRTADPTDCAWFDILGEDAAAEAVQRLYGLGHRRIGFIGGAEGYTYNALRRDGYRDALRACGLSPDPALETEGATTIETGLKAAARLLHQTVPPTAVVCATDMGALGLHRYASAAGLKIGRDLSVIGYDGVHEGRWVSPGLTTFDVDNHDAGERLAALLLRRIHGEPPEALRETAHARLCVRGSDAPPALSPDALAAHLATIGPITAEHVQLGGRP